MQILKRGIPKDKSYLAICESCVSVILFQQVEVKKNHRNDGTILFYLVCPVCGNEVSAEEKSEQINANQPTGGKENDE